MSDNKERDPRGRKKNPAYGTYEEARERARALKFTSRLDYQNRVVEEQHEHLSRYPYRVFLGEWVSWNDYLGTNNKFTGGKK